MVAACTRFVEVEEIGLAVSNNYGYSDFADSKWYLPGIFKIGISCPKLTRLVMPSGT